MDLLYPFCVYFVEPSFCTWEPSSQQAGLCLRDLPIVTLVVGMPFRGILEGIPPPSQRKKSKCHVIPLLKFPMKNWQLHNVSLYSSQSLIANWSLEIGCQRMMNRGGCQTLGGAHFSVWNIKYTGQESSNKHIIFIGKCILAYGLWLQIRVSKTEHWLAHNWCHISHWVIHFFWGGQGQDQFRVNPRKTHPFFSGVYSWLQPPTCSNHSTTNWTHPWTQIGKMVVFHGRTSMASKWLILFGKTKNFQSHQYTTKKLWK